MKKRLRKKNQTSSKPREQVTEQRLAACLCDKNTTPTFQRPSFRQKDSAEEQTEPRRTALCWPTSRTFKQQIRLHYLHFILSISEY